MEVLGYDIQLTVVHIPGKENQVADLLSRWHLDKDNESKLKKLMPEYISFRVHVPFCCLSAVVYFSVSIYCFS